MKKIIYLFTVISLLGCLPADDNDDQSNGDGTTCTLPSVTVEVTDKSGAPYTDLELIYNLRESITTNAQGKISFSDINCGATLSFMTSNRSYTTPHITFSGLLGSNATIGTVTTSENVSEYQLVLPKILYSLKRSHLNPNSATSSPSGITWDFIGKWTVPDSQTISRGVPMFIDANSIFFAQPFKPSSNITICALGIAWSGPNMPSVTSHTIKFNLYDTNLGNQPDLIFEKEDNFDIDNGVRASYGIEASYLDICKETGSTLALTANTIYWIEVAYSAVPTEGAAVRQTLISGAELIGLDPLQSEDGSNWNPLYGGYVHHEALDPTIYDVPLFTISGQNTSDRMNNVAQTPDRFVIEIFAVE